ncbi:MAG: sigma-70 family RNA polymerase sigma factor [Oscillospiraceae bacterium]
MITAMSFPSIPDPAHLSDQELAELVRKGDKNAFSHLARRFHSSLRAKAAHYSASAAECDDYHQEGLLALYRAAMTFDSTRDASFSTYADVCAEHAMIDHLRRLKRQADAPLPLDDRASAPSELSAEESFSRQDSYEKRVHQLSKLLSPFEKQVLLLRLEGYSYSQIAQRLGSSPKAVDNALQRVKRKLKSDG